MKQEILTQFPWPWLPTFALLIFFSFFVILIFRVNSKNQNELISNAERLPLNDGEKNER